MPNTDRVTILKVPARGTAHFDNTTVEALKNNAGRGRIGSLWLYWPTGPGPDERFPVDTLDRLKEASVRLVSKPSVANEVQRLLTGASAQGVEFFSLEDSTVREVAPSATAKRNWQWLVDVSRTPHGGVVFSVSRPSQNVPIGDLWAGFRKALGVAGKKGSRAAKTDTLADQRLSPIRAAMRLRGEFIARGWPTSAEVGRANGSESATNPAQWASDRREAGALLGAWSSRDRTYVHPDFQFDSAGILSPRVKDLLAALATHPDLTPEADKTGWRRVFWLYGETMDLADEAGRPRSAASVFASEPDTVIAFAYSDATVDALRDW